MTEHFVGGHRRDADRRIRVGTWRSSLQGWVGQVWGVRKTLARVLLVAAGTFLVTQPYVILDPIRYFGQVGTEALVARGWLDYPYTRQYANTIPFLYEIVQSAIWGVSLPLGILVWGATVVLSYQWWRGREWRDGLLLSWTLVYFLTIGAQQTKYLRYLLPILPFLFLVSAVVVTRLLARLQPIAMRAALVALVALAAVSGILYSTAYVSIYSREHPWLALSRWIYENVPARSKLVIEQWDDVLPIPMRLGELRNPEEYTTTQLPMYDPDTPEKIQRLTDVLAESDYVLFGSQRLYATIPRLPMRYPLSARYYKLLFNGQLGFEAVAYARNDPALAGLVIQYDPFSDPGLTTPPLLRESTQSASIWNWGKADESFVVYDHPLPILFVKTHALSSEELRTLLATP